MEVKSLLTNLMFNDMLIKIKSFLGVKAVMFEVNTYSKKSVKFYQLKNVESDSWLTVCPERGGIVTAFGVAGKEQLYLDEETIIDDNVDVQGGIPILFPIAGALEDNRYTWNGQVYEMPMHGFAKDLAWDVKEIKLGEREASIELILSSQKHDTKSIFPFDYDLIFTYTLTENQLMIDQLYRNRSSEAMPFYSGFHPYFKTDKDEIELETDATMYLNHAEGETKRLAASVALTEMEGSVILMDGDQNEIRTSLVKDSELLIESGSEFRYNVFWATVDKEFVCIEPWMGLPNELNEQNELTYVESNDELKTFVRFTVEV